MNKSIKDSKILIIDDEYEILKLLRITLVNDGFNNIYTAENGLNALELFKYIKPDLIILDVMLPDMEGHEICKKIRKSSDIPILFLSAKGEEIDRIMGLAIGGDDYITKPFSLKEVLLRIKIQLRKGLIVNEFNKNEENYNIEKLSFGPFEVDENKAEVKKNGEVLEFTAKEYKMFLYMIKNSNQIISKEKLCNKIWGEDFIGFDNTIMVHIRRIREKIEEDPSNPKYIINVKGLGYKLVCKE